MPDFSPIDPCLSRESALNMILHSIALEEVALSHIINAEGEKIQAIVASMDKKCCSADMQILLNVNNSVRDVLEQVKELQMLLKSKMSRVMEYLPCPEPKPPCPHEKPRTCKCDFCSPPKAALLNGNGCDMKRQRDHRQYSALSAFGAYHGSFDHIRRCSFVQHGYDLPARFPMKHAVRLMPKAKKHSYV